MSGVTYGGVPEEIVLILWAVAALLLFASVTTGIAQMTVGGTFLPDGLRSFNERHGWPGAKGAAAVGIARVLNVLFGGLLLLIAIVLPLYELIDQSIRKGMIGVVVCAIQLAASAAWLAYLAVLWRRRPDA